MNINIRHLNKHFGAYHALCDINLSLRSGQMISLLGPSGCGKTTLLRLIAGLEHTDSGEILFNDKNVAHVPVNRRGIGFVFQHYALFRHMNVSDNIAFGLHCLPRAQRPSTGAIKAKVSRLLALVQLEHLAAAYPAQLSGGQRQRIALARALAVEPSVLLLDEPFGALDAKVRKELRLQLRTIHQELNITTVMVTHDQEEALEIADEIVLMNRGKIEQIGSAHDLYLRPTNGFVNEFLGEANIFHGARIEHGHLMIGNYTAELPHHENPHEEAVVVYVRPHDLTLTRDQKNTIGTARIEDIHDIGSTVRIMLAMRGQAREIAAEISQEEYARLNFRCGENVFPRPKHYTLFRQPQLVEYVI